MDEVNDLTTAETETDTEAEAAEVSSFFGSTTDLVDRYSHCALCGSNLHFTHITDFTKDLTFETARCPECEIQVRKVMHRLQ